MIADVPISVNNRRSAVASLRLMLAEEKRFEFAGNPVFLGGVIRTLMQTAMTTMKESVRKATESGQLLPSAQENLEVWLAADYLPSWVHESMRELIEAGAWEELNNRFYQTMKFGTGGLRGRTTGEVVTAAERGSAPADGVPEHAAVGTNMLNDFTVIRATTGLFRYCQAYLEDREILDVPKLVIAHDVRRFSRHFCKLAASTWTRLGGLAMIFDGPRATPHLSFAVRELKATAGVVITASHNPPHDNGYKAYFSDGAQIVSPHAEGIIAEVEAVNMKELVPLLELDESGIRQVPASVDEAYYEVLEENVLEPEVFEAAKPRFVFTPVHGTGAISAIPLLDAFQIDYVTVEKQMIQDGGFPTVKSPNPEVPSAFDLTLAKAEEVGADAVIATDPDADRLGIGARDRDGKMVLYTGNMLGSCLAEYRIQRLKEMEVLPKEGTEHAALIKTFVTTPMQESIARAHGLKCIQTLTGFKWIGEKLRHYEEQLKTRLFEEEGIALDYDRTDLVTRVSLLLEYSTYYVFGGEESYGYLASDRVRDKDATAAILMFCELMAYLKSKGQTFQDYLDSLYLKYGYHQESLLNIYHEGASGSAKIKRILDSYRESPPSEIGGSAVTRFTDYGREDIQDADHKPIPKENFYFLELANGYSYAVRGSGTEPKIKFYCFAREEVPDPTHLAAVKAATAERMEALKQAIQADVDRRATAD